VTYNQIEYFQKIFGQDGQWSSNQMGHLILVNKPSYQPTKLDM
jgi:hypothetical protein